MQRSRLANKYDQLDHRERLRLVIEAKSRDDESEIKHLWATCDRRTYTQANVAFENAHDAVQRITLALSLDLAYQLGRLRVVNTMAETVPFIAMFAGEEAVLAEKLEDETVLMAQVALGEEPPEESEAETSQTEEAIPDEAAFQEAQKRALDELGQAYAEYLPQTKAFGDRFVRRLHAKFAARAMGIVAGLDRFANRLLGLDALTLLRAWNPDQVDKLKEIGLLSVEPESTTANEMEQLAWDAWNRTMARR